MTEISKDVMAYVDQVKEEMKILFDERRDDEKVLKNLIAITLKWSHDRNQSDRDLVANFILEKLYIIARDRYAIQKDEFVPMYIEAGETVSKYIGGSPEYLTRMRYLTRIRNFPNQVIKLLELNELLSRMD